MLSINVIYENEEICWDISIKIKIDNSKEKYSIGSYMESTNPNITIFEQR